MTDIAVAHGNYFQPAGGEKVADAIAEAFDAPLYYGFGNEENIPDDGVDRRRLFHPTNIGKKAVRRLHQYRDFRFMWNGTHVPEFFDYDVIIQSGNEFGWYVPKRLDQAIVKYVHSPPRGPYDMHFKHGGGRIHRAYSMVVKMAYGHTTTYPDVYVANSEVVAQRCRKAWGVDPEVVYPPVDVESYGQHCVESARERTYLTFSRLKRHKRTREIVEAFERLDGNLIVGGDGPQREHLREIAPENVDVRGYLAEGEKRRLLAECNAFIFNAENEDFGIVPIEAFASGTPVIGINDGFTQYQIEHGTNGILYPVGTPDQIYLAVQQFERDGISWGASELERFAQQFSRERFETEMKTVVEAARAANETDPKCEFDQQKVVQ